MTVESVIYTPVETLVRYQVEKPSFSGGYGWLRPHEGTPYIESGKKPLYQVSSSGIWQQNGELSNYDVFPAVAGTGRLVIPFERGPG